MANSYTVLANLRAGRCSNKAEVRLLRFWDAKNIKGGKLISLEMLLIDEEYLRFLSPYVYCLSGRTPTSPGAISVFVCPMPMSPFASMMARLSLKEPIQLSQYQLKCSGIIRAIVIFKYLDESLMFYQFMNGTGRHVGIRVDYSAASWLLLPVDKSDKVTCTKLQSFIEELKQPLYFTTPMAIVVITKLTFQNISMVMVDHLGNLAVTIASLSSSFYNIIGYRYTPTVYNHMSKT
ncbi:hypothetical protein Rs2_17377 [Raphanus sativus]|nr:hypothetical protein Rs2_17377 [Raphanus sativus]